MPSITAALDNCPFEGPFELRAHLKPIEEKVDRFVRRYFKDLMVYGTILLLTFAASSVSQSLGRATQSGANLIWTIGNTSGAPILEDFLIPWEVDPELVLEIPDSDLFEERRNSVEYIKSRLRRPITRSGNTTARNCWLSGPPGIGKTSAVRKIAEDLKQEGHKVYRMTSAAYSVPGAMERINQHLRGEEPVPILILDEGEAALGSWREFNEGVPLFNLLVVSNGTDVEAGMQSRMGGDHSGGIIKWEPWSKEQVAVVLSKQFTDVPPEVMLSLVTVCENVDGSRRFEEDMSTHEVVEYIVPPPDLLRLCEGHLEQYTLGTPLWELLRVDENRWNKEINRQQWALAFESLKHDLCAEFDSIAPSSVCAVCDLLAQKLKKKSRPKTEQIQEACSEILSKLEGNSPWILLNVKQAEWEQAVAIYQAI